MTEQPSPHPGPDPVAAARIAAAVATWVDAVNQTYTGIQAEVAAAGGDPDGGETQALMREVLADVRARLSLSDRGRYDQIVSTLRDYAKSTDPR